MKTVNMEKQANLIGGVKRTCKKGPYIKPNVEGKK